MSNIVRGVCLGLAWASGGAFLRAKLVHLHARRFRKTRRGSEAVGLRLLRRRLIFASTIFFFFLVGRNSPSFAPPCPRKSFVARQFVCRGGAKLPEFRPGGRAKLPPGGAKFVRRFAVASVVQNSPHILLATCRDLDTPRITA
jgi:hypothetical protein